jgi:uracil-DNA glycosylase
VTLPDDIWYGTAGPRDAQIMVVGEAWGAEDAAAQRPFVGQSGKELERMLAEAGFDLASCFRTNVVPFRPERNEMMRLFHDNDAAKTLSSSPTRGLHPGPLVVEGLRRLAEQVRAIRPRLIIACGNYALWALTSCTGSSSVALFPGGPTYRVPNGIDSWRGSQWYATALPDDLVQTKVLPIYHPASILRAWYNRAPTVHDLRTRVPLALAGTWRPNPLPTIVAPPTFDVAVATLRKWLADADAGITIRLLCDTETSRSLMTCVGFADSPTFAISIPWVRNGQLESYWSADEEVVLFHLVRAVLSHPNILIEGQNFSYDVQYFRRYFGVVPRLDFDSMLAHHLLFPGTPKGLDYLSSLYCQHHWYWKEDGKEWNGTGSIVDLLTYNGWDCIRNFESNTVLRELIVKLGQTEQWIEVMDTARLLQRMMFRGVRIDRKRRAEMAFELGNAAAAFGEWFHKIIPQEIFTGDKKRPTPWYQSPTQQRDGLVGEFGFVLPKHKKTGAITFGKEAVGDLKRKHPEFVRLFDALSDFRSIRVFKNTFVDATLDIDNRMRCSYNPAGTETFRFNSSENAFGSGTNLQNIPKGNEDKE